MTEALVDNFIHSDVGVGVWTLDSARTHARISHRTLWGMVTVKGAFTAVTGYGTVGADHVVTGTITVAAASIDTKNKKRDEHLRSVDFLDAAAHHDIVVTVTSGAVRDGVLELVADLTVKSVREPVTLTARITDVGTDTVTATVVGQVDRNLFGLSWNKLGMVKGLTQVSVDAVFTRVPA